MEHELAAPLGKLAQVLLVVIYAVLLLQLLKPETVAVVKLVAMPNVGFSARLTVPEHCGVFRVQADGAVPVQE